MIKMMRIDNRLIHGQVALVWSKELQVNRIIVANDTIVKNEVQKATLKMACPATVKCSILSVADAISVLNDERAASLKILIIINNPVDARRICEQVEVPLLNVGNYGHLDANVYSKKKLTDTVFCTDEDFSEFEKVIAMGVKTQCQMLPHNPPLEMQDLITKAKAEGGK